MPLIRICEARESSVEGDFAGTVSIDDGSDHAIVIRSPFDETQEAELDWYFEEHLRRPYLNQVKAGRIAQSLGGYGESLFKQVFGAAEIYAEYVQQRNQLDQVSVEIEGTPAFHALHWEALKDPSLAQPLALQVPIVRRLRVKQAIPAQPRAAPALRLLMVIARPHGRKDVGYRTITRPLVEALRSCTARVDIDILRPGTYRALDQHLNQVRNDPQRGVGFYHVIHFDVHGALLTHAQLQSAEEPAGHLSYRRYGRAEIAAYPGRKAFVFLEGDETDAADAVEASELATLLTAHQIPITVLNACQSGKQVGASETSLGSHLLAAGAQLVLAMAYSVTVTAAQRLMINLYEQLFDGAELATAIRGARRELYNDKQRRAYFNQHIELEDWLLPVVYQHREVRLTLRELTPQESQSYFERRANSFPEPATTYGFFGRDLEVLEIERRLLCHSLLLVHGMGGAGKTTLLKHLGHWWQTTDFVREVFYFGYDAKGWTRQQIMSDIALQLLGRARYYGEFEPLNEPAQQALLAERLRGERHLVILDNLESITGTHLAIAHGLAEPEREALQSWLASLSGGRTLVLLGSRSEEAWLAPGTFVDNRYELQGLDGEAASNLAEIILKRSMPMSKVESYRMDADFETLLKVLAGFPLALQVVLSNLEQQTASEVLEALRGGDKRLDAPEDRDKTQSILRCVDYAYGSLDADTQALLMCFAFFSGVINTCSVAHYVEALKDRVELAALPFERLPEVFRAATDGGLMSKDSQHSDFLHLQPVLAFFLSRRLTESPSGSTRVAIEAAFCRYYDRYAGALYDKLVSTAPAERKMAQAVMALEHENVSRALQLGLSTGGSVIKPYFALSSYAHLRHDNERGLALGQQVVAHLTAYPPELLLGPVGMELVRILGEVANHALELKEYTHAKELYENILPLVARNTSASVKLKHELSANAHHQLGIVAQVRREWQESKNHYCEALAVFVEANAREKQAGVLHHLGMVAKEQREWKYAHQCYGEALEIYAALKERPRQATTLHCMGVLAHAQGEWKEAERCYMEALKIRGEFNDRRNQASTLQCVGMLHQAQGDWQEARQHYERALGMFIECGDRYSQAFALYHLGTLAQVHRERAQAEQYYQKALDFFTEFRDRHNEAKVLRQLGLLMQEQRQWVKAQHSYHTALETLAGQNDPHSEAITLHRLGIVAREQSDIELAINYLFEALAAWVKFKDQHQFAISLHAIAGIWKLGGDGAICNRLAGLLKCDTAQAEVRLRQALDEDSPATDVTEA